MPRLTSTAAEILQARIREHLERAGRDGDRERIAQRLAAAHARGMEVVGFRRRGREALLYEVDDERAATLSIYRVGRAGQLDRAGTVWRDGDLERWLASHHHYLEWVRPELDPASTDTTARIAASTRPRTSRQCDQSRRRGGCGPSWRRGGCGPNRQLGGYDSNRQRSGCDSNRQRSGCDPDRRG